MYTLKIIIENGESTKIYHSANEVYVFPKSELVKIFDEDSSLIEEFKLVDKKIALEDDLDNDKTEIIVTLKVRK